MLSKNRVANDFDLQTNEGIIYEEINVVSMDVCRICLQQGQKMIRPCACTGSIGTVHDKCMTAWIQSQITRNRQQKIKCEICLEKIFYLRSMERVWKPENWLAKVQKINSCCTCVLFFTLTLLIIISVVFSSFMAQRHEMKPVFIIVIVMVSIISAICIGYILYFLLTDTVQKIQRVLNRSQIDDQSLSQSETSSNWTESRSNIIYRIST